MEFSSYLGLIPAPPRYWYTNYPAVHQILPMLRKRNPFPYLPAAFFCSLFLLVTGCVAPTATTEQATEPAPEESHKAGAASQPAPVRPFPPATLYDLLVAEFAGARDQVGTALQLYIKQAHETRDPGVIDRALRIANYANRQDLVLDLAELWVDVAPGNLDARRLAAFHLARAGRVLEAFPHGQYLLQAGDDEYLQSLAAFASQAPASEKQRLLVLYQELAASHPGNPGLLLGKTMLLRQLDRLDEGLAHSRELVRLKPDHEPAQILHAQLLFEAEGEDSAIKALRRALEVNPDSKRLRLQYARYLAENDLAASRREMVRLAEMYPEDGDLLFSLALVNQELGREDEAARLFNRLVSRGQRTADAHFQLGRLADENQRYEDALDHYRQVSQGRNLLPAAARAAEILSERGDLSTARNLLNRLRAEHPEQRTDLFRLEADLQRRAGDLEAADQTLQVALSEKPGNIDLLYARALIRAEQEDMAAVERNLRAVLHQQPDNPAALNALGYTMLNLTDRYQEAYELIRRAWEQQPDDPAINDSLGWAYYRLGDYDSALKYLRQAFEGYPDPEVAAHLGEVLWVKGDRDKAMEVWQQALEDNPHDPVLQEALERFDIDLESSP